MAKRRTDDRIEETDEQLRPATAVGGKDELLVGAGGRPGIDGRRMEEDEDVGEYEASDESLPPDYEYRVSTAVSDRFGEYPAPGDEDLPLGYTTDSRMAREEGLSYFPPDDPVTIPSDDPEGLDIATGYAPSLRDAGLEAEDLPRTVDDNDLDLAQDVVEAVRLSSILTGFRLGVAIRRRVAYVRGVVSEFDDLARLENVLLNIPGIKDVVMDDVEVSDGDIEGRRIIIAPQAETDTENRPE